MLTTYSSCKLELDKSNQKWMFYYIYINLFSVLQANPKGTTFYLQIYNPLRIIEII